MNLIQTLQKLDKLILDGASISEQRALINSMIEQAEAQDAKTLEHLNLKIAHAKLQNEHAELKRPKSTPAFKIAVQGPYNPTYPSEG